MLGSALESHSSSSIGKRTVVMRFLHSIPVSLLFLLSSHPSGKVIIDLKNALKQQFPVIHAEEVPEFAVAGYAINYWWSWLLYQCSVLTVYLCVQLRSILAHSYNPSRKLRHLSVGACSLHCREGEFVDSEIFWELLYFLARTLLSRALLKVKNEW